MSSPQAFKYTPSATATLFIINNVMCAIDVIQQVPGQVKFGPLERFADGTAQWMGTDADTPGIPVWTIETQESLVGPLAEPNPLNDPSEPQAGLILDYINGMGTKLLTDFKGMLNARLAARFPSTPAAPPATSPPFTNEALAIAWLVAEVNLVIAVPVNGIIP